MGCMADYTIEDLRLMASVREEIMIKLKEIKLSSPTEKIMRLKITLLIKQLQKDIENLTKHN